MTRITNMCWKIADLCPFNIKGTILIMLLQILLTECYIKRDTKYNALSCAMSVNEEGVHGLKIRFLNLENNLKDTMKQLECIKLEVMHSRLYLDNEEGEVGTIEGNNVKASCRSNNEASKLTEPKLKEILDEVVEIYREFNETSDVRSDPKTKIANLEEKLQRWYTQLQEGEDNTGAGLIDPRLGEKTSQPGSLGPTDQVIQQIISYDYDKAAQTYKLINDDNAIKTIVREVYRADTNGLYLLLKFAKKMENHKGMFLLSNYLNNEMKKSFNNNANKNIKFIKFINKEILQPRDVNDTIRDGAIRIVNSLKDELKQTSMQFLLCLLTKEVCDPKKDLIPYLFQQSSWIYIDSGNELLNNIFKLDENLFEEIHKDFLIYCKLRGDYSHSYDNLLKLTTLRSSPEQELLLRIINLYVMNHFGEIDSKMMEIMSTKYTQIEEKFKEKIDNNTILKYRRKLQGTMPTTLYSLLYAEKHCIKNVGLNQYLSTGGGTDNYYLADHERRNVYTDATLYEDGPGVWEVEKSIDGSYSIRNVKSNEYMYAALNSFVANRRKVWMWIPGSKDDTGNWKFEFQGDNVYIKNVKQKEYLYGSGYNATINNWRVGHVYTKWVSGEKCPNQECLWVIEDCSHL